MPEVFVQCDMFAQEEPQPQKIEHHRRVREEQSNSVAVPSAIDFSGVDFSQVQVRQSLSRAYRVLLEYYTHRVGEESGS